MRNYLFFLYNKQRLFQKDEYLCSFKESMVSEDFAKGVNKCLPVKVLTQSERKTFHHLGVGKVYNQMLLIFQYHQTLNYPQKTAIFFLKLKSRATIQCYDD